MRAFSLIGSLVIAGALSLPAPVYALKTLVIINNAANSDAFGPLQLVSANPFEKQEFDKPPRHVVLTFSQPIRPDKSIIRVYDIYGTQLELGTLESDGKSLSAELPELAPGKYNVKWRARCRCDGDTQISDNYHFIVK